MYEFMPVAVVYVDGKAVAFHPLGFNDPWNASDIADDLIGSVIDSTEDLEKVSVVFGRAPRPEDEETDGVGIPEEFEEFAPESLGSLNKDTTEALVRKLAKIRLRRA